ncbi:hypothetical protein GGU10DRAFT_358584 [Lentinula aff. detonsa]|uniref:Secreted protein n=1 Tax=Lentinula aff. detonsa TaxID=2804958 RepID=A0AA38KYV0_9AGAR|nr:hypothetical protein GGU10DRAFT_358584 [Lentinula aff. detonsa]
MNFLIVSFCILGQRLIVSPEVRPPRLRCVISGRGNWRSTGIHITIRDRLSGGQCSSTNDGAVVSTCRQRSQLLSSKRAEKE